MLVFLCFFPPNYLKIEKTVLTWLTSATKPDGRLGLACGLQHANSWFIWLISWQSCCVYHWDFTSHHQGPRDRGKGDDMKSPSLSAQKPPAPVSDKIRHSGWECSSGFRYPSSVPSCLKPLETPVFLPGRWGWQRQYLPHRTVARCKGDHAQGREPRTVPHVVRAPQCELLLSLWYESKSISSTASSP